MAGGKRGSPAHPSSWGACGPSDHTPAARTHVGCSECQEGIWLFRAQLLFSTGRACPSSTRVAWKGRDIGSEDRGMRTACGGMGRPGALAERPALWVESQDGRWLPGRARTSTSQKTLSSYYKHLLFIFISDPTSLLNSGTRAEPAGCIPHGEQGQRRGPEAAWCLLQMWRSPLWAPAVVLRGG